MSYVPPHARNNKKVDSKSTKVTIKVNDFPELVKATSNAQTKPAMDFSKLFNNLDEEVIEKKDELKRGIIKLTKEGIVDSLTPDEREQDNLERNKIIVSKNMIDYYNRINKQREIRCMLDNNYSPEIVVEEYSSSDTYYSTEESEYAEDDPEQEMTEF